VELAVRIPAADHREAVLPAKVCGRTTVAAAVAP
jgi:hypothetical protein